MAYFLPLGTKVTTVEGIDGIIEDVVYIIKRDEPIEAWQSIHHNFPGRTHELGAQTDRQVKLVEMITYNYTHPKKIIVRPAGGKRRVTRKARTNRSRSRSNKN